MRLWPAFEVRQKKLPILFCWIKNNLLDFMFRCCHRFGSYVPPSENCQIFSQSCWAIYVFKCLQRISRHERVEVVDSVIFSQLIVNFEVHLEKVLKQLTLLRFPVKRGHRCGGRFWQFGSSFGILTKVCRFVVVCQLVKGPKNVVCFDLRNDILTAKLRLTGRVVLFLLC